MRHTLLFGVLATLAPRCAVADQGFPRVPPTPPDQVAATFFTTDGFHLDLLAAEPLVTDPVAMDYDENGLAYVVEMSDYPYTDKSTDRPNVERTMDLPIGKIRILEDIDGDGIFDRSDIFATDLSWPTGLAFWKGGIFVAATPDLWYLKDTDGDRKADVREKVFTGFRKYNVQAVMNNLKWGIDNRIYGAGSSNGGSIRSLAEPEKSPLLMRQNDFRFDPHTRQLEVIAGGARFGNSFDDWGNRFLCNIRNPAQHVVIDSRYLVRNPNWPAPRVLADVAASGDTVPVYRRSPVEPWRALRAQRWAQETERNYPKSETVAEGYFTSASGITIYRGNAYPEKYRGNIFLGEVAGNLIHRQIMTPLGATFQSERAEEGHEFIASTDNWFRPVNFVNAPDGTLHVLDMYRETIEHPWSIPDDLKAYLDLESGRDRGRIYRLTPPDFKIPKPVKLGSYSTPQLVAELANPNSWHRETAQRLLIERHDSAAIPLLEDLFQESPSPLARLHAIYCLHGLGAWTRAAAQKALQDKEPRLREHAVKLAEPHLGEPDILLRVQSLANDTDARVRFQVALSLGEAPADQRVETLAAIARGDGGDQWFRYAILSSAARIAGELAQRICRDLERSNGELAPMIVELARVTAAEGIGIDETFAMFHDLREAYPSLATEGVIGLGEGLASSRQKLKSVLQKEQQKKLDDFIRMARENVVSDEGPLEERVRAVRLLSHVSWEVAQSVLPALLDVRQPQDLQMAAVRGIGNFTDAEVADALLTPWRQLTPLLRSEVVEILLARKDRIPALLNAISDGMIPRGQIPVARQAILLKHSDPAIKDLAERVFSPPTAANADTIAKYAESLQMRTDVATGKRVYERECMACHRVGDQGKEVGPNLATIRNRSAAEIVLHVLDPNREVAPNYLEYVVSTVDGRVLTGIIAGETATSVTLRRAEGVEETLLRSNIEEMASTGKSIMPEGLEKKITPAEMASLMNFLLQSN